MPVGETVFSPFYGMYDCSDSAVYGTVAAFNATDISETLATFHGKVQAGRYYMSVEGFAYLDIETMLDTEALIIAVDSYTGELFFNRLTGLNITLLNAMLWLWTTTVTLWYIVVTSAIPLLPPYAPSASALTPPSATIPTMAHVYHQPDTQVHIDGRQRMRQPVDD